MNLLLQMSFLFVGVSGINLPKIKCPDGFRHFNRSWIPATKGFIPSCVENSDFLWCENVTDYPTNLIKLLIENCQYNFESLLMYPSELVLESAMKNYFKLFSPNTTLTSFQIHHKHSNHYNFSTKYNSTSNTRYIFIKDEDKNEMGMANENRIKRQSDSLSLCETRTNLIKPKAALNYQGEWRYLVNFEDSSNDANVLVKTKICRTSEGRCNSLCDVPVGYKSVCEQKFVEKRITALQPDGQKLYQDVFWFPHGCECNIVENNDEDN